MQVSVLNGVNLNMLGKRDPAIYGWAASYGMTVRCAQTNSEGEYVGMIHEACSGTAGLVVNPGAWTHYSYAIRDALEIFPGPVIEVHLSDIEHREEWRQTSVIADVVDHRIVGAGADGYRQALARINEGGSA